MSDEQKGLWMDTAGEKLMRDAFEEHLESKPFRSHRWQPGGYDDWTIHSRWQAFKAGVHHGIEHQKRATS